MKTTSKTLGKAPLTEDPNLTKMKIKFKLSESYSKLGEVPGVLVD